MAQFLEVAMGLPYPVANIASSAIFFLGVHVLARRQPDPLGFLVLLFPILIINLPMSGIRQGAAIGLLCIAFVAFIDCRPLWVAFWVVLATGFHSSALIFILLLPVATGRYVGTGVDAAGAAFRVGILGLSALYFFLFVRKNGCGHGLRITAWPASGRLV